LYPPFIFWVLWPFSGGRQRTFAFLVEPNFSINHWMKTMIAPKRHEDSMSESLIFPFFLKKRKKNIKKEKRKTPQKGGGATDETVALGIRRNWHPFWLPEAPFGCPFGPRGLSFGSPCALLAATCPHFGTQGSQFALFAPLKICHESLHQMIRGVPAKCTDPPAKILGFLGPPQFF
jgi:hypothetical protein